MNNNINGKIAIITGASRGLGAAITKRLGNDGVKVVVNYHSDHQSANKVVKAIESANGQAIAYKADVTSPSQVKEMVQYVQDTLGSVDIVVNNATGPQPTISVECQTWDDHLNPLHFFVKAPLLMLQAVLPQMRERASGVILNIGSEVVELGVPKFGHYVAAKAAMLGLTRSWANELGPMGIRVNLIAPGFIPVERHETVGKAEKADYAKSVPLRRQGTPDELANAVAFLVSDEARFIHGQKFAVNGGMTLL
ncbi:SDR family oxidoreductase [bacterium AH-315-I18]|nr:SDR family oxidoreductase [bacterium AH-315-I18]